MEVIEQIEDWRQRYRAWANHHSSNLSPVEINGEYPLVKNVWAPFTPARRALPMLNLALVSSAGAYLDGTDAFDTNAADGDFSFREIPVSVTSEDLRFASRGYNPAAVEQDMDVLLPITRLLEFSDNRIIGQLNQVFWSFCGFVPDAARLAEEMLPRLVERVQRYDIQAVLLVPASRVCHQSVSLLARAIEMSGIPTMTLAVEKNVIENARPPRAAYYDGELGSVAGRPRWPQHQRRVLDEALRLIEPMDQPGMRKLVVELETRVEQARGEK